MLVAWDEAQKAIFLQSQFTVQHTSYQEHYAGADFLVIMVDDCPAGRLYVARWDEEMRIMDGEGAELAMGQGGEALPQDRRTEATARQHALIFCPAVGMLGQGESMCLPPGCGAACCQSPSPQRRVQSWRKPIVSSNGW